jgi:hypothetical protein
MELVPNHYLLNLIHYLPLVRFHVIQVPFRIIKSLEQENSSGIRDRILYPRLGQSNLYLDVNSCDERLSRGYLRTTDLQSPSVSDGPSGTVRNFAPCIRVRCRHVRGKQLSYHLFNGTVVGMNLTKPRIGQQPRPFRLGRCCRSMALIAIVW